MKAEQQRALYASSTTKLILWTLAAAFIFSVSSHGASWEWDDGGSTSHWSDQNQAKYKKNWDPNTNPAIIGGVTPDITFGTAVSSNQTITLKHGNKTVRTITFQGPNKYKLKGSPDIIFDTGTTGGNTEINILSHGTGNASHTIDVDIQLNDSLIITHETSTKLTFKDKIKLNTNNMTLNTNGTVYIDDSISGSGNITKEGSGTLFLQENNLGFSGNTTVSEGTLQVDATKGTGTGNLLIESGGTVVLGKDNAINMTSNIELAGGTLDTNSYDQMLGTLTLSQNSIIRLGNITGGHDDDDDDDDDDCDDDDHGDDDHECSSGRYTTLKFNDLSYTNGTLLTIDEYTEGEDHIIISTVAPNNFLENVYWNDQNITGATQLASGEIIPIVVPEPSTWLTGIIPGLLGGYRLIQGRRCRTLT